MNSCEAEYIRGGYYVTNSESFFDVFAISEHAELIQCAKFTANKNGFLTLSPYGDNWRRWIHKSSFDARKPSIIAPSIEIDDSSTIWDWALYFCIKNCWEGYNEKERRSMTALADCEFVQVAREIYLEDWAHIDDDVEAYNSIKIFNDNSLNLLARDALWFSRRPEDAVKKTLF